MRKAVILGGIGRSGTSIVRDMVYTNENTVSFGNIEAKFFGESYGLIDLYHAVVTDYRIDKAVVAVDQFETVMLKHMTDENFYGQPSILTAFGSRAPLYEGVIRQFTGALRAGKFVPALSEQAFWGHVSGFVEELLGLVRDHSDAVFVEKTPHNVFNPWIFDKIFSDVKYVWVIREPVSIAKSLLKMDWGQQEAQTACQWVTIAYERFFETFNGVPALVIKYENLIADPDLAINSLEESVGFELPGAGGLIEPQYRGAPSRDPDPVFTPLLADTIRKYDAFDQK